jgi:hypothetical protein
VRQALKPIDVVEALKSQIEDLKTQLTHQSNIIDKLVSTKGPIIPSMKRSQSGLLKYK